MELMTGQFMVTSWEALWEYHNLVAIGVKKKLGSRESTAPYARNRVVACQLNGEPEQRISDAM